MRGLAGAVGLLTRIPVPARRATPAALPWLPPVGALVGLAGAGVYAASATAFPPVVAGALAVASQVALTGAIHEDGLADVADAAGKPTIDDRLRVLRDPALGTYGVLAVVLAVVLRVSCLAALPPGAAVGALTAAGALGRAAALVVMAFVPPARSDGLGAGYTAGLRGVHVGCGVAAGALLGAAMGWRAVPATAVVMVVSSLACAATRWRFGGLTGDSLGATEQAVEIAVLLVAVAR